MLVVGLTGDVGAGKSTVARFWRKQGAFLIDSDEVVRSLWATEQLRDEALRRFGKKAIHPEGGSLDLSVIAEAVFSNEEDYRWVCGLIHPLALDKISEMLKGKTGWIVVELPLLFEAGRPPWIDLVVFVSARAENRIEWTKRRGWANGEISRREKWLLPSSLKEAQSDIVLKNNGSLESFLEKVERMGRIMKELSMEERRPVSPCEWKRRLKEAIA